MIKPTIGRVVLFRPNGACGTPFVVNDTTTPCDAHVAYVWNDRMVNLAVTDHSGMAHNFTSVRLLQDDEAPPTVGYYCEWMPYQKDVASGKTQPTLHAPPI